MQVAIAGLGRMGAGMARRAARGGHDVVVWNRTESVATEVAAERENEGRVSVAEPLDRLLAMVEAPRHVVISVPNDSSQPGMGRSFDGSAVSCRKTPEPGPPLCSWPVECRNRGP